jgi:hypothetical protein
VCEQVRGGIESRLARRSLGWTREGWADLVEGRNLVACEEGPKSLELECDLDVRVERLARRLRPE